MILTLRLDFAAFGRPQLGFPIIYEAIIVAMGIIYSKFLTIIVIFNRICVYW